MADVRLNLNEQNRGAFSVTDDGEQVGEMVIRIRDNALTVYHAEVSPEVEGKGYAKEMLNAMVNYARGHHLHVIPLCPFVHAQFKEHPDEYADVWKDEEQ